MTSVTPCSAKQVSLDKAVTKSGTLSLSSQVMKHNGGMTRPVRKRVPVHLTREPRVRCRPTGYQQAMVLGERVAAPKGE